MDALFDDLSVSWLIVVSCLAVLWFLYLIGRQRNGRGVPVSRVTRHIVQGYVTGEKGQLLLVDPLLVVRSAAVARSRAKKLYGTGRYAGVDAYTVTYDEETDEYGEPVFHVRLGRVPHYENG